MEQNTKSCKLYYLWRWINRKNSDFFTLKNRYQKQTNKNKIKHRYPKVVALAQWVENPKAMAWVTAISGLTQWVKGFGVAAAMVEVPWIQFPAQELPCVLGVPIKKKIS